MKKEGAPKERAGGKAPKGEQSSDQSRSEEKASIGGAFNSGVTSDDPAEKDEIEKQGSLGKKQPLSDKEKQTQETQQQQSGGLTKEDIPDSTNESTGAMGSGQRQDSN